MAFNYTDAVFKIRNYTGVEETPFTHIHKTVLHAMAERINKDRDDGKCWPSFECLAKDTYLSRRTCIRAVEDLKAMGLILLGEQEHLSNTYIVDYEAICKAAEIEPKAKVKKLRTDRNGKVHDLSKCKRKPKPTSNIEGSEAELECPCMACGKYIGCTCHDDEPA